MLLSDLPSLDKINAVTLCVLLITSLRALAVRPPATQVLYCATSASVIPACLYA